MLDVISLASYGFHSGGAVGNLLYAMQNNGVFAYVLPFIFLFAVLFVILQQIPIFKNQKPGINAILAVVIALMALQLNFVSYFFEELFPRMGVVTGILIVATILIGLFFDFESNEPAKKIFGWILAVILILIIGQSLSNAFGWNAFGIGWEFAYWWQMWGMTVVGLLIFVGIIVSIVVFGGKKSGRVDSGKRFYPPTLPYGAH